MEQGIFQGKKNILDFQLNQEYLQSPDHVINILLYDLSYSEPELSTGQAVLVFCPVLSCRTGRVFGFCPVLPPARTKVESRTGQKMLSCAHFCSEHAFPHLFNNVLNQFRRTRNRDHKATHCTGCSKSPIEKEI